MFKGKKSYMLVGIMVILAIVMVVVTVRGSRRERLVESSNKVVIEQQTVTKEEVEIVEEVTEEFTVHVVIDDAQKDEGSKLILGKEDVKHFIWFNPSAMSVISSTVWMVDYSENDTVQEVVEEYTKFVHPEFLQYVEERARITDNPEEITGTGDAEGRRYVKCYSVAGDYLGRVEANSLSRALGVAVGEAEVIEDIDSLDVTVLYNNVLSVEQQDNRITVVVESTGKRVSEVYIELDSETNQIKRIEV